MKEEISGWRAKIGVLSPPNPNLVCEWNGVLPEGVTFYTALMELADATPEKLLEMRQSAVGEARKLADCLVDIILFGCTSGSFIGGAGYDESIIKELETTVGIPSTTTSTCVLTAFADLGVKKIALIGPYLKEVFDAEVQFFKQHAIDTLYVRGLGYHDVKDFVRLHEQPYLFYRLAKEAYQSARNIDAIFITCMASPARKVINTLERETGKAVISSCSASLYGVLKQLGIKDPVEEFGQLGRMLGES